MIGFQLATNSWINSRARIPMEISLMAITVSIHQAGN